ncbi:succinate-semialdehyde dehydrogenase (NADP(+)) (plasmid) [Burkholderia sp. KK1]|nr:succinate-semialdehyde dehydrogenase (NADP(+)) [Burkholderia sp. KK1]
MSLTPSHTELQTERNLIDGQWRECLSGARYEIIDPATGSAFATVPDSGPEDARMATAAAQAAFDGWRFVPARERARTLKRWHGLIVANSEELAKTISREQGKPLAESRAEVGYGASYVEWFAEEAVRTYGDTIPEQIRGRKMTVTKEPVGVVVAITPWNFPLAMIARKVAPALAAGCTVVAKPAEDTPLTSLALARLAEQAGIPPGVLNVVACSRENAAEVVGAWLTDFRIRKITFTGSTAVGKVLARDSASTLKRLSLELGGNAPFIVFEDANLDAAVEGLMASKFRNGGQTCVCPNRVYVHDAVYKKFADKLVARVKALRVGPGTREESQIGPMINARAVGKIESHVQDALARGGELLTGGRRISNEIANGPNYFAPTVIAEANHDMALASEETFGPVVALFRFSSEDEAVRLANDTPYGLASYFYSRDIGRVARVTELLQTGLVGINEGVLSSEAAPFGGVKESGYGREGSRYGLDDYMQTKYQCQGGFA